MGHVTFADKGQTLNWNKGNKGVPGVNGQNGESCMSAYELAINVFLRSSRVRRIKFLVVL